MCVTFVFSGQGSQWCAMGRKLLLTEPVFQTVCEQCDREFGQYVSWSVLKELQKPENESRLDETAYAQPVIFTIQIALAALWRSWGIVPEAVVGHSLGEVAAAYVADILSLSDAVRIVFHRSRLMQQATGKGKMAAIGLSCEEALDLLAGYEERLSVAAINSPNSVVVSGDDVAITNLVQDIELQGHVFCRLLNVNCAFHSFQMVPFENELVSVLQGIEPKEPSIPIFSTVTGSLYKTGDFDARYWGRNLIEPVQFAASISAIAKEGYDIFLEISPHPVLSQSIIQCLPNKKVTTLSSLRRGQDDRSVMLTSLSKLYTIGIAVNWSQLYSTVGEYIRLTSYPWQEQRYWVEEKDPLHPIASSHSTDGVDVSSNTNKNTIFDLSDTHNSNLVLQSEPRLQQRLEQIPQGDRLAFLIAHLQTEVAKILGLDSEQLPSPKIGFFEMGMDSLMVSQLREQLITNLEYTLSPSVTFNYPTIEALAQYLAAEVLPLEFVEKSSESCKNNADELEMTIAKLEQISEEEIEALLIQKLQTL